MKKVFIVAVLLGLIACNKVEQRPIVIFYDNDVHCAVDGYAVMAGWRDDVMAADTAWVGMVSVGDYLQGRPIGAISRGGHILQILNEMKYDAVTIGNHEFDYGPQRMFSLLKDMPVTCVNFTDMEGNKPYADYVMKRYGDRQVAFVGVLTDYTLQAEAYAFADSAGCQTYNILDSAATVQAVQKTVLEARHKGADYVVVLSHLGEEGPGLTSHGLIRETSGIDVLLDGHTHNTFECVHLYNKEGKDVVLSQTGTAFAHVGKLLITVDGHFSTTLLDGRDTLHVQAQVAEKVDSLKHLNDSFLLQVVGTSEVYMPATDEKGVWLVRHEETALGDFCADAIRWAIDAQMGIDNGGAIRANLQKGEVTVGDLMAVKPFHNNACRVLAKGSVLLEALERGIAMLPANDGGFPQVSGMKYTVKVGHPNRVTQLLVQEGDSYSPVDPDAVYSVAMTNYCHQYAFDGAFAGCEVDKTQNGLDYMLLVTYLKEHLGGHIGPAYALPQGRITVSY